MNNRRRVGSGGGTFVGIVQSNEILTPRSTGQQPYQDHNYYSRTGPGLLQTWTNRPRGETRRTFESTDAIDAKEETPGEKQYHGKTETGVSLDN